MNIAAVPSKGWHATVGFVWGVRAIRTARSQLRPGGLSVSLPSPPSAPYGAGGRAIALS